MKNSAQCSFSEVDVATGPGSDIYASLLGLDEDLKVLVRVSLRPWSAGSGWAAG